MSESELISKIFQGGYPAIIAVLGAAIVYLHRENKDLRAQIKALSDKYTADMKAATDKYIADSKAMYEQQVAREKEISVLGANIVHAIEEMSEQALEREREKDVERASEPTHKESRKR